MSGSIEGNPLVVNRTRARRPCDSCRKRKSRCELEGDPPCVLCKFHHQECTFIEEPRPRKRKAKAGLDERSDAPPTAVRRLSASRSPDAPSIRQDQPVEDYAQLRGPTLLKKTLGLQRHRHSQLLGPTSHYERLLLRTGPNHAGDEMSVGTSSLRKVDDFESAFILTPDFPERSYDDEIADLDAIETVVAPHGRALIDLYFRIVHPSFPILHKKVFLEKYERTHREFCPPLLAALYILALNWWSYSTELGFLAKPDCVELERLALKSMNDVTRRPRLSTIQAGLLLLQRPGGDSWALTTQLVGLGQDLGLHLDCSSWRIPSWEIGLRKRLGWSLFMQDKWGALAHGRPSHITPADWDVQSLDEEDFPENAADEDDEDGSTEVEKGRMLFCEMIKLSELLASVLSTFYTMRAEKEISENVSAGTRWILEKAKPIQIALKQWYAHLPPELRMEFVAERKLSSTGYLHLGYFAVEITLHRRIIRSLQSEPDPRMHTICRQAAQARLTSALDFVQNLRSEHLQSFWHSVSKYSFALIGTFISLLWATAVHEDEAQFYKSKLDEYRWTLKLSSKSADIIERALHMLATSTGILVKSIPAIPRSETLYSATGIARGHHQTATAVQIQSPSGHQSETESYDERSTVQGSSNMMISASGEDAWNTAQAWGADGSRQNDVNAWLEDNGPSFFPEENGDMMAAFAVP